MTAYTLTFTDRPAETLHGDTLAAALTARLKANKDLRGARLRGLDLRGADLTDAILDEDELERAERGLSFIALCALNAIERPSERNRALAAEATRCMRRGCKTPDADALADGLTRLIETRGDRDSALRMVAALLAGCP